MKQNEITGATAIQFIKANGYGLAEMYFQGMVINCTRKQYETIMKFKNEVK